MGVRIATNEGWVRQSASGTLRLSRAVVAFSLALAPDSDGRATTTFTANVPSDLKVFPPPILVLRFAFRVADAFVLRCATRRRVALPHSVINYIRFLPEHVVRLSNAPNARECKDE